MEDFNSPNLQLVLGVKEGCHFDRVQKPTVVIATLNGHFRESKKIHSDCSPQYATDLTWDTDKNSLRKMRCNQTPVKIECYAVNDNGSREKLGYTLLSVRSAQLIYQDKEINIKSNWHDVLGVRNEFNNCRPKLLLYLIIREKPNKTINSAKKEKELCFDAAVMDILPLWLQEEHLIQLGPLDTCQDVFLLHITAYTAINLRRFTQDLRENTKTEFNFLYNIFDNLISLKPFTIDPESNTILNETIILKIRTSLTTLVDYLNTRSHFFVTLRNDNIIVGQSEINLKSLINASNLQEFTQKNKHSMSSMDYCCVLKNVHSIENKGDYRRDENSDKLPSLRINVKMQYVEPIDVIRNRNISEINFPMQTQSQSTKSRLARNYDTRSLIQKSHTKQSTLHPGKYLDSIHQRNQTIENLDRDEFRLSFVQPKGKMVQFDKSTQACDIKYSTNDSLHCEEKKHQVINNTPKSYCLLVNLDTIKFFHSKPNIKNIEFKFHHSKGDIITSVCVEVSIVAGQTIELQGVKCKLYFISTLEEIDYMLATFMPRVDICDATSTEKECIAQVHFDIQRLFHHDKLEYECKTPLIDCCSLKEIGQTDVSIVLKDYTILTSKKRESELVCNDDSTKLIIDELETWKEKQKNIFMEELRKKEEVHLTLLHEEWKRRRECLETKLTCSVQQCKTLMNNLNKTTENLRIRKIQSLEKETKLIQANQELQWKYERKLHQLQDALQKMQEEFSVKLRDLEDQNRNLISQIESLNKQKNDLEIVTAEQVEKINTLEKAASNEISKISSSHQLKNLEETLTNTQKSKLFFKEQWTNAVKEIHKLKMENQKAVYSDCENNKEQLDNLHLEELLNADTAALTCDQIALNQIQREIDVIDTECTSKYYKTNTNDQLFTCQNDLCLNLDHNFIRSDSSTTSSVSDKKIKTLIEERDSLLKTGNYSSDDHTIVKLNTEIRSLLINS